MSELVVIAGMSGAGRTVAADNLEDLGWFVMDNLPPALIPKVAELADGSSTTGDRLALVVGSGRYHEEMAPLVAVLRSKFNRVQLIFLDASTEALTINTDRGHTATSRADGCIRSARRWVARSVR